jgi:NAD(P)-dependent dehydrogenase (short-subunit alcohol dehydrogenase family)
LLVAQLIMTDHAPVWLITGCSSGFGRELARVVLDHGHRVVATARNIDALSEFSANASALTLALDVTDPAQIAQVVAQAVAHFGSIDVLVNNAGYLYFSAIETGDDTDIRAIFETNFFGALNLCKAVLPGMRERRRGHIVNISSTGGQVSFPGVGYYTATKFALEGLSEALSQECASFGVKVLIVEPGTFRTEWAGSSFKTGPDFPSDYDESVGARLERIKSLDGSKSPGDPVRGSEAIFAAVMAERPPLRLVLGMSGYDTLYHKAKSLLSEMEDWRDLSLSADFPAEQVKL